MRPKLDGGVGAEEFAHKKLERAFQVRHTDVLVDVETFDLMKLRAMGRVDFVAAVSRAWSDHADRRRPRLHRADLNGGGMRAEQSSVRQIKCVLLVACWMFRRCVQRVEAMPFVV